MRSLVGRRVPVLLGTFTLLVAAFGPGEKGSWTTLVASRSGAAVLSSSLAGDAVLAAKPESKSWARAHRMGHAWSLLAALALAALAAAALRWRLLVLAIGWACLTRLGCARAVRAPPRLRLV